MKISLMLFEEASDQNLRFSLPWPNTNYSYFKWGLLEQTFHLNINES